MPIQLFPKCFRNRTDCEPVHCIDAFDENEVSEEQFMNFDYTPKSFVCSGLSHNTDLPQDAFRLCFKNDATDEMTENDIQDLTHIMAVISQAMALYATRMVNGGTIEVPTKQGTE